MVNVSQIREHMEVIGADGVHVGTVDKLDGDRIKLTKSDSGQGSHQGHHHYLSVGLVAAVEGDKVRLSATGANAFMFQEEDDGSARLIGDNPAAKTPTAPAPQRRADSNDWAALGLGAAAISVVTGAAMLFNRKRRRNDDFVLRLQDDETGRLISSSKVEGTAVVDRRGDRLGTIANVMVDKYTGRVAYAVMAYGGTLGIGENLFPLPWSALTYDVENDGYMLRIYHEQLYAAPRFKASEVPSFDSNYRRHVARYYANPKR